MAKEAEQPAVQRYDRDKDSDEARRLAGAALDERMAQLTRDPPKQPRSDQAPRRRR